MDELIHMTIAPVDKFSSKDFWARSPEISKKKLHLRFNIITGVYDLHNIIIHRLYAVRLSISMIFARWLTSIIS